MSIPFPVGLVTLVFTDIEGSSALWERHPTSFQTALDAHNRLIRECAELWQGYEVRPLGDGFFLSFARVEDAVQFAVEAQRAFLDYPWPSVLPGLNDLRVRIGLHSGEPILDQHPGGRWDYSGPVVNRAARVGAAGHGRQIVISESTRALTLGELPPGITLEDLGVHRLKGVGEERLWQVTHPALPRTFPPLNTLNLARHDLPLPLTPFVGRETEIKRWLAILRKPSSRVVTLLGPGGVGKTRVALQLAELCIEDYPDGAWWVPLEEANSAEGMVERIARALQLQLQPQPAGKSQLLSFLRERELMLVLDNAEQIPDAGDLLNELISVCPNVRCLVTSRRVMKLQAEQIIEVDTLPPADAEILFEVRARARDAQFSVTAENCQAVRDLCSRLEGVPLAIELAATWIDVLSPREILQRLKEPLRLLQTRSPDLPARQRALRGVIDWSYERLPREDQSLFAQLSVFSGGFTMAAAEQVCDADFVLEGVVELRRQSLLRGKSESVKTRYGMLETLREYAGEKLHQNPDLEDRVVRRSLEYFLQYAETQANLMQSRQEMSALEALEQERENLLATLQRAALRGDAEICARLALALYEFEYRRGLWTEAQISLRTAWDAICASPQEMPRLRAALGRCRGNLMYLSGDVDSGIRELEDSLALSAGIDDDAGFAEATNLLALAALDGRDLDTAELYLEESMRLRSLEDHAGQARALHNLGLMSARQQHFPQAAEYYERSLAESRAAGDLRQQGETLLNLGALAYQSGDPERARHLYGQSLPMFRELHDRYRIGVTLYNLAELAEVDDPHIAVALYCSSERLLSDIGSALAADPPAALAKLAHRLGTEAYQKALEESRALSWEEAVERAAEEKRVKRKG